MRMGTRIALVGATILSSGLMGSGIALAQEAPPAAPVAEELPAGQTGLEDIVVTARKIEESIEKAPVAVSVLSEAKIRTLGLNSIDDFAKQATGISFSQAFGRSSDRPVVRGASNVLANVQFGVESGAAYFVDGIYYQGDIQGFDPESLQRVEVIKGPQSALYGRNTYAGAINFLTKDPTEKLTVSGRASAAQYNEYAVSASISGQLIPGLLGFRVGGRHYEYGGQYVNQLTGRKVGNERTESIYALLNFTPSDDLKIRLRGQYQHNRDGPLALFLQGAADNNCAPGFRSARFRAVSSALPYIPATLGTSTNTNQYFCGTIQPQPNNIRLNTDPVAITIPG
ncbi:MAG: TonB-dependent receptor plug domain-containing protein, partial [Sphingomonas sp.]|nr:TonB-dependent receptor plug domain-containing protein [Sphingomonas sp.]